MTTIFLLTASVFDDRTILNWSSIVNGESSPIQHIGQTSEKTWTDTFGSILETDSVRLCVTDRRKGGR